MPKDREPTGVPIDGYARIRGRHARLSDDATDHITRRRALTHSVTWKGASNVDLAKRFGVSPAAIKRDIQALEMLALSRILQKTDGMEGELVSPHEAIERLGAVTNVYGERITALESEASALSMQDPNRAALRGQAERIRRDPAYTGASREYEILLNNEHGIAETRRSILENNPFWRAHPKTEASQTRINRTAELLDMSNREIADQLGVMPQQVSRYRKRLRDTGVDLPSRQGGAPDAESVRLQAEVAQLMDSGMRPREIAETLGLALEKVHRYTKGVRERRGAVSVDPATYDRMQREAVLVRAGFTTPEIARLLYLSTSTVYKDLVRSMTPEEKEELGVHAGRRPPLTEEDHVRRAAALAELGIDPESAQRLQAKPKPTTQELRVGAWEVSVPLHDDSPKEAQYTTQEDGGSLTVYTSKSQTAPTPQVAHRPKATFVGFGGEVDELTQQQDRSQYDSRD